MKHISKFFRTLLFFIIINVFFIAIKNYTCYNNQIYGYNILINKALAMDDKKFEQKFSKYLDGAFTSEDFLRDIKQKDRIVIAFIATLKRVEKYNKNLIFFNKFRQYMKKNNIPNENIKQLDDYVEKTYGFIKASEDVEIMTVPNSLQKVK